jgi:hypothetical protein
MTPWCQKQLPCDKYDGKFQCPGLFNTSIRTDLQKHLLVLQTERSHNTTRGSRLHCLFITGESGFPGVFGISKCCCKPILLDSPVCSEPGSLDSTVMNTSESYVFTVMNTLGCRLRIRIAHKYSTKFEILSRHV